MVMPRMGARECFRKLKALDPNVVAILSTGYVQNDSVQEIMTDGMSAFIQKPYQLAQLAAVVEQVMRGRPRKECRAPAKPAGIDAIPSAEHPLHS
jgi:DNA-binding NtrC family response regulator